MNLPVRSILSANLYPNKIGARFNLTNGSPLTIYRNAGHDLRFMMWRAEGEPYVPSNVSTLYMTIRRAFDRISPKLIEVSLSAAELNSGCSVEEWEAGTSQHALISLKNTQTTNLEAGTFALTIWGITTDDFTDYDVFGMADLQVIDAGIDAPTPETPAPPNYVTTDMLAGMLSNYVLRGMNPDGTWIGLPSPSGAHRYIIGMNDDGTPMTDIS